MEQCVCVFVPQILFHIAFGAVHILLMATLFASLSRNNPGTGFSPHSMRVRVRVKVRVRVRVVLRERKRDYHHLSPFAVCLLVTVLTVSKVNGVPVGGNSTKMAECAHCMDVSAVCYT